MMSHIYSRETGSYHRILSAAPQFVKKVRMKHDANFQKNQNSLMLSRGDFKLGKMKFFTFFDIFFRVFCSFVTGNRHGLFCAYSKLERQDPN